MMERDGIGNIAGTAKHYAHEPSSVGTLVESPLPHDVDRALMSSGDHVGAGGGEGNCPLWDGHIIDATFPLV